jgi:hypothetical protein
METIWTKDDQRHKVNGDVEVLCTCIIMYLKLIMLCRQTLFSPSAEGMTTAVGGNTMT